MVDLFVEEQMTVAEANAALAKSNLEPLKPEEEARFRKGAKKTKPTPVKIIADAPPTKKVTDDSLLQAILPPSVLAHANPSVLDYIRATTLRPNYRADLESLVMAGLAVTDCSWLAPTPFVPDRPR